MSEVWDRVCPPQGCVSWPPNGCALQPLSCIPCWATGESCSVMSDSLRPHGLYSPCNSPGQNTGVGSFSLRQRIFPTQGLNPGLPHCRWILYQLSHKGTPSNLYWELIVFKTGFHQGDVGCGINLSDFIASPLTWA